MAQCPTGYVGRLFWPCSHFSGFMGNGQNLWHPVHFCLEGRGHSAISYRTTGFPRLFFLFFQASLGRPPSLGGVSFFSLSPLRVSCNTNVDSRRFHETYLQIIFIQISVFSLERISSFFSFASFDNLALLRRFKYSMHIYIYVWVIWRERILEGILKDPFRKFLRLSTRRDNGPVEFQTFAISFHVWIKLK